MDKPSVASSDFLYAPEAIELLPWADKLIQGEGIPTPDDESQNDELVDLPAGGKQP